MIRWAMMWTAAFLFLTVGCSRKESAGPVAEPYLSDEASVGFDLEPLPAVNGSQRWIGTYASQGKVARFRIELDPAKNAKGAASLRIQFGEGRFAPETGSDSSALLADLRKALEAKIVPPSPPAKISVPFRFASIGENMSQAPGGGFTPEPPGNWTALKLFVGEGDQEGEVFLNINPRIRKGQFSIKDPDYGDAVLRELAKAL